MTQLMQSTDVAYEIGRAMHLQLSISNIRFVFVSLLPSFHDHYVISFLISNPFCYSHTFSFGLRR